MPYFSIILTTYNRAELARRAVQSVIDQTFDDWELWIIDDGSTDGTSQMLEPFTDDSRIHYLLLEHGERSRARNIGIEHTHGAYACFLDDDDVYLPDYLSNFVDAYNSDAPPDAILRTGYKKVAGNNIELGPQYSKKIHESSLHFAAFNMCGVWSLCIPRMYLVEDQFPEQFPHWQDTHLILRLFYKYPLVQLDQYDYHYTIHDAMGSNKKFESDVLQSSVEVNVAAIRDLFENHEPIASSLPNRTLSILIGEKYLRGARLALEQQDKKLAKTFFENVEFYSYYWKSYILVMVRTMLRV